MNVLLTSVSDKTALVRCFREIVRVVTVDGDRTAPALQFGDWAYQVPPWGDPDYVPTVLEIAQRHKVGLIVPLADPELKRWATVKQRRIEGPRVGVCSVATLDIVLDKLATADWLRANGFEAPETVPVRDFDGSPALPVIAKPRFGNGSKGVQVVLSPRQLEWVDPDSVVQRLLSGREWTVDVFADEAGKAVVAVPRKRLKVSDGEVTRSLTMRHEAWEDVASRIVEALPGAYGPMCVQGFLVDGEPWVTEINARFSGGYPLTHDAGAPFTQWLIQDAFGFPQERATNWESGLMMLRWMQHWTKPAGAMMEKIKQENADVLVPPTDLD